MTPEQLDEIEYHWHIAPDVILLIAALRSAWTERDEALQEGRSLVTLLKQAESLRGSYRVENSRLKIALLSITRSSCCDSCREAALVAVSAFN